MPTTFRNPRTIAEQTNDRSEFGGDGDYDAEAGTPRGVAPQGPIPDPNAHPVNPADPPAPARNLKG